MAQVKAALVKVRISRTTKAGAGQNATVHDPHDMEMTTRNHGKPGIVLSEPRVEDESHKIQQCSVFPFDTDTM